MKYLNVNKFPYTQDSNPVTVRSSDVKYPRKYCHFSYCPLILNRSSTANGWTKMELEQVYYRALFRWNLTSDIGIKRYGGAIRTCYKERPQGNYKLKKMPRQADHVTTGIKKMIDEDNMVLYQTAFNRFHSNGSCNGDWLESVFIIIPKISNAKKCSDYRLICLMSLTLKLFLKCIHNWIYEKSEVVNMGDTQFRFRAGLGTRDNLLSLQVLVQNFRDMRK